MSSTPPTASGRAGSEPARADTAEQIYCPACGYDLRMLTGASCPECGGQIDREALRRSQIPWAHRAERGRIRSFWRTVWQVLSDPRQFAREAARPVNYADARRFQLAVIVWTVVGLGLIVFVIDRVEPIGVGGFGWRMLQIVAGMVLLALFLLTATGVHTYWLHPRALSIGQQNRAVALGYYAAAPLAFAPILALAFVLGLAMLEFGDVYTPVWSYGGVIVMILSVGALAALPVVCGNVALVVARRAAQREGLGFWTMALALPVLWVLLAALWLVLVPGLIAWAALMVWTL